MINGFTNILQGTITQEKYDGYRYNELYTATARVCINTHTHTHTHTLYTHIGHAGTHLYTVTRAGMTIQMYSP